MKNLVSKLIQPISFFLGITIFSYTFSWSIYLDTKAICYTIASGLIVFWTIFNFFSIGDSFSKRMLSESIFFVVWTMVFIYGLWDLDYREITTVGWIMLWVAFSLREKILSQEQVIFTNTAKILLVIFGIIVLNFQALALSKIDSLPDTSDVSNEIEKGIDNINIPQYDDKLDEIDSHISELYNR